MTDNLTFRQKLFKPVDSFTAECFLRFFGVIIVLQVYSYTSHNFIQQGILASRFLFTYDYFEFVKPMPAPAMKFIMFLIFASGILLIINKFRKIALAVFLLCFSYFFLLEKSYYNNHFYLFLLFAFIFLFYDPVTNHSTNKKVIPYWFLLLLQVQIVVVYFYGGLAKLNYDWIYNQQPMRILLEGTRRNTLLPDLNGSALALYLITYGGLFYDLCVGFMLWIKKTRKFAIIVSILFHVSNYFIFNFGKSGDIGVFPLFMIGSLLIFTDAEFARHKLSGIIPSLKNAVKQKKQKHQTQTEIVFSEKQNTILACISIYLAFQLLFPLRHWLYKGNVNWTEQGNKFSWRMKVHSKVPRIKFYVQPSDADSAMAVNAGGFINNMQEHYIEEDPVMILQFAQFLGSELNKAGYPDAKVFASAKVSLNGRPFYAMVDSTVNLLTLSNNKLGNNEWILPFPE